MRITTSSSATRQARTFSTTASGRAIGCTSSVARNSWYQGVDSLVKTRP
eukprot:CAMPEP_0175316166 /NCGR_PEP_ID=MMETSP0093-20121207/69276_1 /TAXON_ID=311494 /ORGANISM="Alexandrium monilatum, Strain CCMP3105" /LENGTH=48 /DNA_ID= /DNA_START= /DNA_END= /DNA_ORIENTATION=